MDKRRGESLLDLCQRKDIILLSAKVLTMPLIQWVPRLFPRGRTPTFIQTLEEKLNALYQQSFMYLHGVRADIVLTSNPQQVTTCETQVYREGQC